MLDTTYLNQLLSELETASYQGIKPIELWKKFVGDKPYDSDEASKFVYHINEILKAGLVRPKEAGVREDWINDHGQGDITLSCFDWVLTPAGYSFAQELKTDSGFKRFKHILKTVGMKAGESALSATITHYVSQL